MSESNKRWNLGRGSVGSAIGILGVGMLALSFYGMVGWLVYKSIITGDVVHMLLSGAIMGTTLILTGALIAPQD